MTALGENDIEVSEPLTLDVVEDFLIDEAELLDTRRYDEWLDLFTPDGIYWLPSGREDTDPTTEVSIIYDDDNARRQRIARLSTGKQYAQDPPSRTAHVISSVRITSLGDPTVVRSTLALFEVRNSRVNTFPARVEHRLRVVDGSLRIASKRVYLLNSDHYIDNLTFPI